jgi:hypothetical protein
MISLFSILNFESSILKPTFWTAALLITVSAYSASAAERPSVVVVVGASGTSEYASDFARSADQWKTAAAKGGAESIEIGLSDGGGISDRDRLQAALTERVKSPGEPLWIVLIGHGTFDGREAKFNLRGPDVNDVELAKWLESAKRKLVVIDCSSSSAPFLNRLSGENRIIVTATKSGSEVNYSRFGHYIAESIADSQADLDKDGQVSLLEAYLLASHRVEEFYRTRSQLASEHALLDDNGDRRGTPAEWFRGVRATRRAKDGAPLDGIRAHQLHLIASDRERRIPAEIRRRRDELEVAVAALRDRKSKLGEDEYYAQLEKLMLELGQLYRRAETESPSTGDRTQ